MIKTIVFDIGKVVKKMNWQRIYAGFAERVGVQPELVSNYYEKQTNHFYDLVLGKIPLEIFWNKVRESGGRMDISYEEIWLDESKKNMEINTELLEVIKKLRKQYKVIALTNLTPARFLLDEKINIYSNFDESFLSCVLHLKKPDPDFFELALKAAGAKPQEAIFVDDVEKYVTAANELGIHGIQYEFKKDSLEDLIQKLRDLDVEI